MKAIIFGSVAERRETSDSDIDLFIYGNDDKLDIATYETALKREIQVFTVKNEEELRKFSPGLLQNIINGYRIKGRIDDLVQVSENAAV
jgi:predicted nucleotidyltransferase